MSVLTLAPPPVLRQLIVQVRAVRAAVEELVYSPPPHTIDTIMEIVSAVPMSLCIDLCNTWETANKNHSRQELAQIISIEDRLFIEMVQAMYDHRRTSTVGYRAAVDEDTDIHRAV
jgi:hypothetical protein